MSDEHLLIRRNGLPQWAHDGVSDLLRDMTRREVARMESYASEQRVRSIVGPDGRPVGSGVFPTGQTIRCNFPQRFKYQEPA